MKTSEALEKLNEILDFKRGFWWIVETGKLRDVNACFCYVNNCKSVCAHVVDEKAFDLIPKLLQVKDEIIKLIEDIGRNKNLKWSAEIGIVKDKRFLRGCCKRMVLDIEDVLLFANANVDKPEQTATGSHRRPQEAVKPSFRVIIQHPDKDGLLKRLHELIDDETSSAMVGATFLRAYHECYIKRMPTQREFDEEFPKFKYNNWQAIHKYMKITDNKALDKAKGIVIFNK